MENYQELSDVIRKISLASIGKPIGHLRKSKQEERIPKDAFMLVHMLCLLFGVLNIMPITFFVTANDYWMYKFRDTSKDTIDLNKKTTLQTYFTSGISIVQTVPSMASMLLSALYGPRFKVNSRIILTLILQILIFLVFTAFIKVNTDTWQMAFFIMSLTVLAILTGILNLFQISSMAVIPKFPPVYMKTFLFGQGMASVFGATLQIISLALGSSSETSALFYFISGTLIIIITLALYLIAQRMEFFNYYMQNNLEQVKKKHTKEEMVSAFKKIWPASAILIVILVTTSVTHPSVTSLVVSENYGNGNRWNDVYFVPAITFLFSETCSQAGRLLSRPVVTKTKGPWVVCLAIIRTLIVIPLVWFCNVKPRDNLPVLLSHDWEYILVIVFYFSTSGFLLSALILSTPLLAPGEEDVAYLIILCVLGVSAGCTSPLSLLAVRIL